MTNNEKSVVRGIRIPRELYERLQKLAEKQYSNIQILIRQAIAEFLEKNESM